MTRAAAALGLLVATSTAAVAVETLKRTATPGAFLRVAAHHDIDEAGCIPRDPPSVVVTTQPKKGSTLIGLELTTIPDGKCRGTMVDTRVLLYMAEDITGGDDRFEYEVGHSASRVEKFAVAVRIPKR